MADGGNDWLKSRRLCLCLCGQVLNSNDQFPARIIRMKTMMNQRPVPCCSIITGYRLFLASICINSLVMAGCQQQPMSTREEAVMVQKAVEPVETPRGLHAAADLAWAWWEMHKTGFPEFRVSPPQARWKPDGKFATYRSGRKDGQGFWFATTYRDRPHFWEITMPTQAECDVVFSISVDDEGKARFTGIRLFYPIPGLFE